LASAQTSPEVFRLLDGQARPYVLIDRALPGVAANFVGVDDVKVGWIATEHLIDVGCRTVAYLGGVRLSSSLGRPEGYRRTLEQHGMSPGDDYVVGTEELNQAKEQIGYEATKQLLCLCPRPDGIFCYADPAAMGAILAIAEAGFEIPQEVAVVGCGNCHYDEYLRVPLTSVDQQSEAIARRASQVVVNLLANPATSTSQTIRLTPKLVVRASATGLGGARKRLLKGARDGPSAHPTNPLQPIDLKMYNPRVPGPENPVTSPQFRERLRSADLREALRIVALYEEQ